MLESISEELSLVILGRDLTGSSEEAMKVSMKFVGKNRLVLSCRFDGLQPFKDKVEVRLVEDYILILHMRENLTQDDIHHTQIRVAEERNVIGGKRVYCLSCG